MRNLILIFTTVIFIWANSLQLFGQKADIQRSFSNLILTDSKLNALKELRESNGLLDSLMKYSISEADRMLSLPDLTYTPDELGNILPTSREMLARILNLGLAYRITKDSKYLSKVKSCLNTAMDFPDWLPKHFLDVSEMTTACSIGYDWIYSELNEDERFRYAKGIYEKGLSLAYGSYQKSIDDQFWFLQPTEKNNPFGNWQIVTNAGLLIGALAVKHQYPQESDYLIKESTKRLKNYAVLFYPDGSWLEGISYWSYAVHYYAMASEALQCALNSDYGLSNAKGLDKTGIYYLESHSPTNRFFNFGDTFYDGEDRINPVLFWISKRFYQPFIACYLSQKIRNEQLPTIDRFNRFLPLLICWFEKEEKCMKFDLPKSKLTKGSVELYTYRSNPGNSSSLFLSAKAGNNMLPHQHLDIGSFIVEDNGIRWIEDLGVDSYALKGYFDSKNNGRRWTYFRTNNLSHNTLVFEGQLQNTSAKASFVKEGSDSNPFAVLNMTEAYKDQAMSVERGFKVLNDRMILLQDEVLGAKFPIRWAITTSANVSVEGNEVTLSKKGESYHMKVIGIKNVQIHVTSAKPPTSAENQNEGFCQISFVVNSSEINSSWCVVFSSNRGDFKIISKQKVIELSKW